MSLCSKVFTLGRYGCNKHLKSQAYQGLAGETEQVPRTPLCRGDVCPAERSVSATMKAPIPSCLGSPVAGPSPAASLYPSFHSIYYLLFTASSNSFPWLDAKPIWINFPSMTLWVTILNAFQIVLIAAYTRRVWPAICNHNEVPSSMEGHPAPAAPVPQIVLGQARLSRGPQTF